MVVVEVDQEATIPWPHMGLAETEVNLGIEIETEGGVDIDAVGAAAAGGCPASDSVVLTEVLESQLGVKGAEPVARRLLEKYDLSDVLAKNPGGPG